MNLDEKRRFHQTLRAFVGGCLHRADIRFDRIDTAVVSNGEWEALAVRVKRQKSGLLGFLGIRETTLLVVFEGDPPFGDTCNVELAVLSPKHTAGSVEELAKLITGFHRFGYRLTSLAVRNIQYNY